MPKGDGPMWARLSGCAFNLKLAAKGRAKDSINEARNLLADPASHEAPAERAELAAAVAAYDASRGPGMGVGAGLSGAAPVDVPRRGVLSPAVEAAIIAAGTPAAPAKPVARAPLTAEEFGRANWQALGAASAEAGAAAAQIRAQEAARISELRVTMRGLKARGRGREAAKRGDPRIEECRAAARAVARRP